MEVENVLQIGTSAHSAFDQEFDGVPVIEDHLRLSPEPAVRLLSESNETHGLTQRVGISREPTAVPCEIDQERVGPPARAEAGDVARRAMQTGEFLQFPPLGRREIAAFVRSIGVEKRTIETGRLARFNRSVQIPENRQRVVAVWHFGSGENGCRQGSTSWLSGGRRNRLDPVPGPAAAALANQPSAIDKEFEAMLESPARKLAPQ